MEYSLIAQSLGKVISAAAWGTGDMQSTEIECLKDLLFQLPALSQDDWQGLSAWVENPVTRQEQSKCVRALKQQLETESAQSFAFYALERVLNADGCLPELEKSVVQTMQKALSKVSSKTIQKMELLLGDPLRSRYRANQISIKRVFAIDIKVDERVEDMAHGHFSINMSEDDIYKLCLAGILLARVLSASEQAHDMKLTEAIRFLKERWELTSDEAQFVIMVSMSDEVDAFDMIRVCRRFYDLTDRYERIHFLDVLFRVSRICGDNQSAEFVEVLNISANLKIEHIQFQRAYSRVYEIA